MNDRPNGRRRERGAHSREELAQNRPADYTDRPRRSGGKRKNGKALYYGVLVLLLGVLVFSSVKIISYMMEKKASERNQRELIDQVVTPVTPSETDGTDNSGTKDNTGNTTTGNEPDYISVDFSTLQAKYPDVVGYVYSANTTLQLPIVQSADEGGEYYLYRDIDGKDNKNGTVFLDIRCNSDFTSQNNLIYGHNMKTGMMFASLMNYKSQSYYEAHPYFYLYTPNQTYKVNLFAGCIVDHDADVYATSLSDSYLQQCINESTFKSGSGVPTGSILTLSTCDYDFDNARYVLMGELIPVKNPADTSSEG